jgi:hypothetical protein
VPLIITDNFDGEINQAEDGIHWFDAPLPRRWHKCKKQSVFTGKSEYVARCACGAVYIMGGWIEKNSRRKSRRKWWKP